MGVKINLENNEFVEGVQSYGKKSKNNWRLHEPQARGYSAKI